MFNIEKAHFIIDEMVMSGYIVETNKTNILNPVVSVVKASQNPKTPKPQNPIRLVLNRI